MPVQVQGGVVKTPTAQGVARELPPPTPMYSQVPEVNGSEEKVTSVQETIVETGHPKYSKRDVIVTRDPFYTCPMGFNFEVPTIDSTSASSQQKCFKMEVADFVLGCPNGWAFNGVKCTGILTSDTQQTCDEGSDILMDEAVGIQCIQKLLAPKLISCPENYLLVENECVFPMHSKPDLICPESFVPLNNGNCQKDIRVPAALECPPEYVLSNGECEKRVEMPVSQFNKICPLGFTLDTDGNCTKQVNVNASYTCKEGYERSSMDNGESSCVRSVIIDARHRCSQEGRSNTYVPFPLIMNYRYDLVNNQCVKRLTKPPVVSCEQGFSLENNVECVKHKKLPAKFECPKKKDYLYNPQTKLCHSMSHHHSQKTHPPLLICPMGSVPQESDYCLSVEKSAPKVDCAETGWVFDKTTKLCVYNEYTSISFECPTNSQNLGGGKCKVIETEETDVECPPEFTFEGNGLCVNRIQADPQIKCPNGSSATPQGTCLKIELILPKPICPEGLRPSITVMDGQLPLCIGREIVPKQETCPPSYELVTASDSGLRRCRTYTKSEPIIACANGFVEDVQGCVQTITSSPRLLCPEDYILQYSRCIKQVEDAPNKMCPAGFELIDDEQCSQTVYSKPIPNCPDDYLFDNIVKRCYKVDVQYDFASVDTSVFRQNYTSTVQTGESSEREERSGDSETIKETFQSSSLPFQNQVPNYQGGRYPPFQRMLPPQTPSLPMRPPVQTLYPPQAYLQNGAYSNYGGVPSPMAQQNIGAAGYGYPFPGFQQYAPAPRLTNSPSYPVYMRSLSEENGEL
ncbi:oocyst wall protein 7 [Cryptosporidium canis]|uniref:Oocyst wall protein 7 n=1 Tax=Cryptosporidium canis TaxID=195482 RepID=A0A9D5DG72_9CRYT|nr:oocyst wall protein 7 [Cryptosporidium canis]